MDINSSPDINSLKQMFEDLDKFGYYSILMVYHSLLPDYWIKCSNILDKDLKIKYMPAVRTYALSPEYFSMMYDAFEEIQEDRIVFNVLAGNILPEEKSLDNLIEISHPLDTHHDRVLYTKKWLAALKRIRSDKKFPSIVISGTSADSLESAVEYGEYSLCMMDDYLENMNKYSNVKNKMVSAIIVIRDSNEEAFNFIKGLKPYEQKYCIAGTEDYVILFIKKLSDYGVTDIMIRPSLLDKETHRIHSMVKKLTEY
jgi:hypothetical protein